MPNDKLTVLYFRYSVVVFTGRDELNETIESYVTHNIASPVRNLLDKCGNRYVAFNNCELSDDSQVQHLVKTIDTLNGNLYEGTSRIAFSQLISVMNVAISGRPLKRGVLVGTLFGMVIYRLYRSKCIASLFSRITSLFITVFLHLSLSDSTPADDWISSFINTNSKYPYSLIQFPH